MPRVTAASLRALKSASEPIAVLTAYDYPSAALADECGVDAILVGDSCANVVMGLPTTLQITMDDMLHHVRIVSRAVKRALVIADMPFLSYHTSPADAVRNAGRFMQEAGAHAVKLEGPVTRIGDALKAILNAEIPVMGHLGLTPQSVHRLGGYGVQGVEEASAKQLVADAQALAAAGVFGIVLEKVPAALAREITEAVPVPTIGIGAGKHCDGQVLVMHDMLGLGLKAKHTKIYRDVKAVMGDAFREYVTEVKQGAFPTEEHGY